MLYPSNEMEYGDEGGEVHRETTRGTPNIWKACDLRHKGGGTTPERDRGKGDHEGDCKRWRRLETCERKRGPWEGGLTNEEGV